MNGHRESSRDPDLPVSDELNQLVELASNRSRIVAFTGAGISTESGMPDYRGPNGVWATGKPPTLGDFKTNTERRQTYWESRVSGFPELIAYRPNRGHLALTRLHRAGLLTDVVTQNIDGLHRAAGMPPERVIELHGNAIDVKCLDCETVFDGYIIQDRVVSGDRDPKCDVCGGPMRGATVLFGQSLPVGLLDRSIELAKSADLLLAVGSSLVVQPAAKIPLIAKRNGAALVIINLSETPLDEFADLVIRSRSGDVLPLLADHLLESRSQHDD